MAERMKGITCCGDCGYYNWKEHKCSRGANVEIDAKNHFYDDCPLPDVIEVNNKGTRAKVIDELKKRFRADFEEMMANNMEDCVNWADWLDVTAEEMKGGEL